MANFFEKNVEKKRHGVFSKSCSFLRDFKKLYGTDKGYVVCGTNFFSTSYDWIEPFLKLFFQEIMNSCLEVFFKNVQAIRRRVNVKAHAITKKETKCFLLILYKNEQKRRTLLCCNAMLTKVH